MEVTYNITREDYWRFNDFYLRRKGAYRRNFLIFGVIAAATASLFGVTANEPRWLVALSAATGILLTIPYAYLCYWLTKRKAMKIPDEGGSILGERTLRIDAEGVFVKKRNVEGSTKWSGIREIVETPDFFYFFSDATIANIVPRRVFPDPPSADAFLAQAKSFWKKPATP